MRSSEKLVVLPGNVWTTTTPLPRQMRDMASVSMNNRIYLLGKYWGLAISLLREAAKNILRGGVPQSRGLRPQSTDPP